MSTNFGNDIEMCESCPMFGINVEFWELKNYLTTNMDNVYKYYIKVYLSL